jgi:hypothetical protein
LILNQRSNKQEIVAQLPGMPLSLLSLFKAIAFSDGGYGVRNHQQYP